MLLILFLLIILLVISLCLRHPSPHPSVLFPCPQQSANHHELAEVISIMIRNEQRFTEDGLTAAVVGFPPWDKRAKEPP